ncbi:hypothetical protein [Paracoccus sp. SY]|uniref:hypothetical protein n=1 Tax=Paracoccus sp. SY TaxID=1330255 RepID=UPI000CD18AE5|nr:hypothetical protein [Paracoccus sp. SY]
MPHPRRGRDRASSFGRLAPACDPADPAYRQAAGSCIAFAEGTVTPEQVRADFIQALNQPGCLFVKDSSSRLHG